MEGAILGIALAHTKAIDVDLFNRKIESKDCDSNAAILGHCWRLESISNAHVPDQWKDEMRIIVDRKTNSFYIGTPCNGGDSFYKQCKITENNSNKGTMKLGVRMWTQKGCLPKERETMEDIMHTFPSSFTWSVSEKILTVVADHRNVTWTFIRSDTIKKKKKTNSKSWLS